jgi:hypothetical protein
LRFSPPFIFAENCYGLKKGRGALELDLIGPGWDHSLFRQQA